MSKRSRLVLHVGYPKAGSSSLQETLFNLRTKLKEYGIFYPEQFLIPGTFKHEELFRLVRLGKISKAVKHIEEEYDKAGDINTIVLSTESVVNQLFNIGPNAWIKFFEELKATFVLELIVIKRAPDDFKKSYYKQAVVNQPSGALGFYGTHLTYTDFCKLDAIQKLSDAESVIKTMADLSGSPVRVFNYSSSVVREVVHWLTDGHLIVDSTSVSNVSLKNEEAELIRQLNNIVCSSDERNAWLSVLNNCSQLASNTARTLASRATADNIMALDILLFEKIDYGLNPSLEVDEVMLRTLVNRMKDKLTKMHANYAEDKNRLAGTGMKLKEARSSALARCVHKKLESTTTSKSHLSLGEKLFAFGQLELAPFKAVDFLEWSSWEQDPLNNRSWQWRLNWLSFIPYLLAYHRSAENDGILDMALDAIESWLDNYLSTDRTYPFEFIWHDHATALRAEQLVLFFYYCKKFAPKWACENETALAYVERALLIHGEWLVKDSFYSKHTNHGLEQARVLLLLSTVFMGAESSEWKRIAVGRIGNELAFAFTDEGVHVENSPAYHVFVFKVFIGIIKDYPASLLGDLAVKFDQLTAKALNFIAHIMRPDALLPPIGDTEQLPTSDAYKEVFGDSAEYHNFLYAFTKGKQGTRPNKLNVVYPQSGYAIFRNQWPDNDNYLNAFHVVVKVGCSSRYHHQQDEGHISVYAGGEDWLIDSGLYNYVNKDPIRRYMRSRQAHNIPIISGANYAKEFEHRLSAWRVLDYDEDPRVPYLKMQLDVLEQVKQLRRVSFNADNMVLDVRDDIESVDMQERNIILQWHIPKDKSVEVKDGIIEVQSASCNAVLIEFIGDAPDNISVAKGQKENKMLSYVSYRANQAEPSKVLRVLYKGRSTLSVVTRFTFSLA